MKQLTCEMCGSTDLTKTDGVFVCQTCSTKYSVEDAKKMMVEGTVEVQGTVKVDNTSSVANFLKMADSAYESGNKKEAENYCNKIIEIDSENYEAWFLKGKAAGWQSTLANIRIEESVNCFVKAIDNAPDDVKEHYKKESTSEVINITTALLTLCSNNFNKNPSEANLTTIKTTTQATQVSALKFLTKCCVNLNDLNDQIFNILLNCSGLVILGTGKEIVAIKKAPRKHECEIRFKKIMLSIDLLVFTLKLGTSNKKDKISAYLIMESGCSYVNCLFYVDSLDGYSNRGYFLSESDQIQNIDLMMQCHANIKEIDPDYTIPARPDVKVTTQISSASTSTSPSGGCYVATAVYGAYDCPEVWTLRRFRDNILAENLFGRAFIHTYYTISPTLVKWFGETKWFKRLWKSKLDSLVKKLGDKGIENTPYEDRNW